MRTLLAIASATDQRYLEWRHSSKFASREPQTAKHPE